MLFPGNKLKQKSWRVESHEPAITHQSVAQIGLNKAIAWYDVQEPELGDRLMAEVRTIFDRIRAHPARFPITDGETRVALVAEFPYAVYFNVESQHIVVIAVIHTSRDTKTLRKRK